MVGVGYVGHGLTRLSDWKYAPYRQVAPLAVSFDNTIRHSFDTSSVSNVLLN